MAREEVTLDVFAQWCDRMAADFEHLDLSEPLQVVAYMIAADTKENFSGAHTPDGETWPPLKRPRRDGRTHPLWDTGRLVASVGAGGADHIEEIGPYGLLFGTTLEYAPYQNYGTSTIPAREFLGITDEQAERYTKVIADWIERKLAE